MADGLTWTTASLIAANAAAVNGIRSASAESLDTVGPTPSLTVGPTTGRITAANYEVITITYPARLYLARTRRESWSQRQIANLLDLLRIANRSDITLGGTVTQCLLTAWDADRWVTIDGAEYQVVDLTYTVDVHAAVAYTA